MVESYKKIAIYSKKQAANAVRTFGALEQFGPNTLNHELKCTEKNLKPYISEG